MVAVGRLVAERPRCSERSNAGIFMYLYSLPFEDSSNIIKNLYSTFSETLTAKGNHLEKKDIVEEESARWHNTTCSVVKEVYTLNRVL